MPVLTVRGYIVVPDDDLAAVKEELPRHIESTRKEKGCLTFHVTQRKGNRNVFDVYEEFIDRDSFNVHQARAQESHWGQVAQSVKRHYQIGESS